MAPKLVVTRILPPDAQRRLEQLPFELVQWQQDCTMPRDELLQSVKGKLLLTASLRLYFLLI